MAYKFQTGDKDVAERKEYLPFGINKARFVGATASETEAGKDYIEIAVATEAGIEDSARVWFVGKAAPYSFQTVQQIIVHSVKSDSDKEKARQAVEACNDSDELADLLNKKCVGAEVWVTKYYDPSRTYTNANGELKKSVNTNIYGYAPKLKPELMPQETDNTVAGAVKQANAVAAEALSGSANIPSEWS